MAIVLNGTTGIQNVLGSASAPADTNTTTPTTGVYYPSATTWGVSTAGTNALYIDASQNVGIGTTPTSGSQLSTIQTTYGIFGGSSQININTNAYYNGGWKYIGTGYATLYSQNLTGASGAHTWSYSASGTAGNAITFNEAMRIDSSGNLLVGTTTANGKFSLVQAANGAVLYVQNSLSSGFTGPMIFSNSVSAASTNWYHLYGVSSGNTVLNIAIYGNGNIVNANNSYGAISDVSLKENIVDATPKLSDLMQVKIRNYNLKSDEDKTKQIGVVAQELETVFPAMIETNKDGIKGVKYSVFVPMLVKAIQELKAEFDQYKAAHP